MQFEEMDHIDKKIKEAADSHFPSYDDGAWKKMESLLDKHLPQQKERKRRIILFFLLFLFLAGGGGYLLISRPWNSSKISRISGQESLQNKNQLKTAPNRNDQHSENLSTRTGSEKKDLSNDKNATIAPVENTQILRLNRKQYLDAVQETMNNRLKKTNRKSEISQRYQPDKKPGDELNKTDQQKDIIDELSSFEPTGKNEMEQNKDKKELKEDIKIEPEPVVDTKSKKVKKNYKLFLAFSAGPDVSVAGTKEFGQLRLSHGIIAGFTYHEKFTLRTGIFSARKIYSTPPDYYNPPPVFWTYYPNLKRVDADCDVVEIPVLLTYNFSRIKNHSFSVTVGLSSYLMKRETYNYSYINSSGQPANRKYTINNVNKHYFSVLTLAGGYHRKFNNTFSLSIEPYIKVPFNGVGYGKVHLNSAGILVSTGINFFR